jgi:hypothetical protein
MKKLSLATCFRSTTKTILTRRNVEHNPPKYLSNTIRAGGVQASASQPPDPHWKPSLGGMLPPTSCSHWTVQQKNFPIVFTVSVFLFIHVVLCGSACFLFFFPSLLSFAYSFYIGIFMYILCCVLYFAATMIWSDTSIINSHQEPVSGQACNPHDFHWFFFWGRGVLRYPVPKWLFS